MVLVDGKPVSNEAEIRELAEKLGEKAQKQAQFVNGLEIHDKIRKCAMAAYYGLKKFYLHFSDRWYPAEKLEEAFKSLGDGPLEERQEKHERTQEEARALFDPRVPWTP